MRILPALAASLSLLFLAACWPESDDEKTSKNKAEQQEQIVDTTPAPETRKAVLPKAGTLDPEKILSMTFGVTTSDNRKLNVTTTAYCSSLDEDMRLAKYRAQCRENIGKKLAIVARVYRCFEGSIPATGNDVRAHAALPESDGYCYDKNSFPESYSFFTVDMMKRVAERTDYHDLYTVTKIEPE